MKYIKLINSDPLFLLKEYNGEEMWILSHFLTSDLNSGAASFKKLILSNQDETASIFSWLTNKDNKIRIGFICDEEDPAAPVFEISKEQFIKLLDEWGKLYNEAPQEIIITYENGIINLEGKNYKHEGQ